MDGVFLLLRYLRAELHALSSDTKLFRVYLFTVFSLRSLPLVSYSWKQWQIYSNYYIQVNTRLMSEHISYCTI